MPNSKKQTAALKKLGARLKTLRQAKGLTLREMGYRIDKDPQSISRVEMGDVNPTYLYLLDICEGLEIGLAELLDE